MLSLLQDFKKREKSFNFFQIRTFALIKPDSYVHIGKIIDRIEREGFVIGNLKMTQLSQRDAREFYSEHSSKHFFNNLVAHISSDYVVGLELVCEDSI
jgi:nucleoside-diphosphate kinase